MKYLILAMWAMFAVIGVVLGPSWEAFYFGMVVVLAMMLRDRRRVSWGEGAPATLPPTSTGDAP